MISLNKAYRQWTNRQLQSKARRTPCAVHLAYRVRAMYNGRSPVTARDIALIYCVSQSAIICAMHRSEKINLVRRVSEREHGPSFLRPVVQLAHRANVAGFARFERKP